MGTIFPTNFASTTLADASSVLTPLVPYIEVVGGVLLAVIVVGVLIRVLTHH